MSGGMTAVLDTRLAALDTADGSLELLYQPEVDLATGAIVAMEGLVRWHVQDLGVLAPGAFFTEAASAGRLSAIEEWVLRTGAAEAAVWQGLRGGPRQLRLNVSTAQLRTPGFYDLVADVVAEHRLPVGALGLEVSEQTLRRPRRRRPRGAHRAARRRRRRSPSTTPPSTPPSR